MENGSDEELVARFLAGKVEAYEALARRYQKPLVRFLFRYVSDVDLAEEIFQETFIRVFRKAASFDQGRKFKTWLYTIALNLARTEISRKRSRPKMVSLDLTPDADGRSSTLGSLLSSDEEGPADPGEPPADQTSPPGDSSADG